MSIENDKSQEQDLKDLEMDRIIEEFLDNFPTELLEGTTEEELRDKTDNIKGEVRKLTPEPKVCVDAWNKTKFSIGSVELIKEENNDNRPELNRRIALENLKLKLIEIQIPDIQEKVKEYKEFHEQFKRNSE